jgi:hypothetical protein
MAAAPRCGLRLARVISGSSSLDFLQTIMPREKRGIVVFGGG